MKNNKAGPLQALGHVLGEAMIMQCNKYLNTSRLHHIGHFNIPKPKYLNSLKPQIAIYPGLRNQHMALTRFVALLLEADTTITRRTVACVL